MRYFITTHTIQGKNGLQSAIIREVENWEGTLIEDGGSYTDCTDHFKKVLEGLHKVFVKCRPCQMSRNDNSISFSTCMTDDTFAILTFHEVKYSYDGISRWKEKEGGKR